MLEVCDDLRKLQQTQMDWWWWLSLSLVWWWVQALVVLWCTKTLGNYPGWGAFFNELPGEGTVSVSSNIHYKLHPCCKLPDLQSYCDFGSLFFSSPKHQCDSVEYLHSRYAFQGFLCTSSMKEMVSLSLVQTLHRGFTKMWSWIYFEDSQWSHR